MKKILCRLALSFGMVAMIAGATVSASASNWDFWDNNVEVHYWDVWDWNVAYSGVTNQISYNSYAPCVARSGEGYNCGAFAHQSEYREFALNNVTSSHTHALQSSYNTFDYVK